MYGSDPNAERRYAPPVCISSRTEIVSGDPDPALVSTSYIERQNLSIRMASRRFTRLTNAFSKRLENHVAAVSLYVAHYNLLPG